MDELKLMEIAGFTDAEFTKPVDGGPYTVMINPSSIHYLRNLKYTEINSTNTNEHFGEYKVIPGEQLHFDVVIDCTGVVDKERTNMMVELDTLQKNVFETEGSHPTFVRIKWGEAIGFKGVLTSIETSFTLFSSNGTALRTRISLAFNKYIPVGGREATKWSNSSSAFRVDHGKGFQPVVFQQDSNTVAQSLGEPIGKNQTEQKWPTLLTPEKSGEGIAVKNAGIVLLSSYFTMLFERLNLLNADNFFFSKAHQLDAVHYLQYLISGISNTEESLLQLNKIICGVSLAEPVPKEIQISEENKQLFDSLINAAIGYWPAIGDCSVDGFRGNWFVRDGMLMEQADRWQLTIEKRAYDILIHKSPFSFSIIKLTWMDKPIHVSWPY